MFEMDVVLTSNNDTISQTQKRDMNTFERDKISKTFSFNFIQEIIQEANKKKRKSFKKKRKSFKNLLI